MQYIQYTSVKISYSKINFVLTDSRRIAANLTKSKRVTKREDLYKTAIRELVIWLSCKLNYTTLLRSLMFIANKLKQICVIYSRSSNATPLNHFKQFGALLPFKCQPTSYNWYSITVFSDICESFTPPTRYRLVLYTLYLL